MQLHLGILGLMALTGPIQAEAGHPACGTPDKPDKLEIERQFYASLGPSAEVVLERFEETPSYAVIDTYYHIIQTSAGVSPVTDQMIIDSHNALNQAFAPRGIQFVDVATTRTDNDDWYTAAAGSAEQTAMKTALRRGGDAKTLNVYLNNPVDPDDGTGLVGYATFPDDYAGNPLDDGVVILDTSVPGGSEAPYDEGKTLVHEVGHWFGLSHMAIPSSDGCPNNYMDDDDSDDVCLTEFTPGQNVRMMSQWCVFRCPDCAGCKVVAAKLLEIDPNDCDQTPNSNPVFDTYLRWFRTWFTGFYNFWFVDLPSACLFCYYPN